MRTVSCIQVRQIYPESNRHPGEVISDINVDLVVGHTPISRCYRSIGPFLLAWFFLIVQCWASASGDELAISANSDRINYKFRFHSERDIGAVGEVRSIVQDSQGFIWFGGTNALSRWDGSSYRLYLHSDADLHSMSTNNVNDMIAVEGGDLFA